VAHKRPNSYGRLTDLKWRLRDPREGRDNSPHTQSRRTTIVGAARRQRGHYAPGFGRTAGTRFQVSHPRRANCGLTLVGACFRRGTLGAHLARASGPLVLGPYTLSADCAGFLCPRRFRPERVDGLTIGPWALGPRPDNGTQTKNGRGRPLSTVNVRNRALPDARGPPPPTPLADVRFRCCFDPRPRSPRGHQWIVSPDLAALIGAQRPDPAPAARFFTHAG